MTTKEKAPLPVVDGASSEGENRTGKTVLETENSTPAKCRVCGEPLRPQDFEICGTCKTWGNYALFLKPLRGE